VSCVSSANCVAVGSVDNGKAGNGLSPLAETWQGTSWKTVTVKLPPGAFDTGLAGVSCTSAARCGVSCVSAARCVAVGSYAIGSSMFALIESWNGKSWTRMNAPAPAGSGDAFLTGVSCASAKSCVAVGTVPVYGQSLTAFSDVWNGKTWRVARIGWPKGTGSSFLTAVSCASAARCFAVGRTGSNPDTGDNTGRAAAVSWNGKAWTATRVPAPVAKAGS
jgi:hypothetical protein